VYGETILRGIEGKRREQNMINILMIQDSGL